MPVGHIWKIDLEQCGEKHDFAVKMKFSKIRIAHVILNFLAKTENIRNERRTTELQLLESGKLKQWEIAIHNFRHLNKHKSRTVLFLTEDRK